MVFSSQLFLFYFLPIALAFYYAVRWGPRWLSHGTLTVLSYLFYGWTNPLFMVLMASSTVVDYLCGLAMAGRLGRRFDEPMEVGNLTGTISVAADDGRPFVHLHAVLAPRELIAYSGHVHEARTGAVMEIIVWSFPVKLERDAAPDILRQQINLRDQEGSCCCITLKELQSGQAEQAVVGEDAAGETHTSRMSRRKQEPRKQPDKSQKSPEQTGEQAQQPDKAKDKPGQQAADEGKSQKKPRRRGRRRPRCGRKPGPGKQGE